jgi:hypothetical protein
MDWYKSAAPPGGTLGRKLGKMWQAEKVNPWFPDAQNEFADSIRCDRKPVSTYLIACPRCGNAAYPAHQPVEAFEEDTFP